MCKIYHVYDLAMLICDFCIVQQTTVDSQYKTPLFLAAIGFISYQYHALFNIVCVLICQIMISLIGALIYKDEHALGNFFVNVFSLMVIIVPAAILVDCAILEYSELGSKNQSQ